MLRKGRGLSCGDLVTAQWLASGVETAGLWMPEIRREQDALARARVQIAAGEGEQPLLQSVQALEAYRADAVTNGRARSELEISIVLALAYDALGNREQSTKELSSALSHGYAQGYRRIFLDEGQPLMALIKRIQPELPGEQSTYARTLLYLFGQAQHGAEPAGQAGLVEPLSEQEKRVLRLLAAGQSNAEIAKALFISVNTVKTHVKNIYGKLGIGSRAEARQAARQF